jgi:hypothetical protein
MPDKYALRPTDLGSRRKNDDFVFRFNGHDVGRTYADGTAVGPRWYLSIYGINLRGPLPEGLVVQGLADDLAAAKAAFKANWERLLSAGSVKFIHSKRSGN